MIDYKSLAEPVAGTAPCGADCEYESDFLALSQAVVGKPEQQFGDTVIPAVDPEWETVELMATALLDRTKDLRVAVWLTLASIHNHGMMGFSAGLSLILALCQQYWDDVHPQMVIDGDVDPYMRINALSALSDGGGYSGGSGIMKAFRASQLVSQPLPLTIRDVELNAAKDASARYTEVQIARVLADAINAGADQVQAFRRILESVSSLDALIGERFGSAEQPDLTALKSLVRLVGMVLDRATSQSGEHVDHGHEVLAQQGPEGDTTVTVAFGVQGQIRSRADVKLALDQVCDYLERFEPSNPAALFARRAQNMLDRNFLDIMQELSPDSVHQLQVITGGKLPEEQ